VRKYAVEWSDEAKVDLAGIRAHRRRAVMVAVDELERLAEVRTRHRKPLAEPLEELPPASWQVAVGGDFRVFYWVDTGKLVRILRVIQKGRQTTAQALGSGDE
jgi:mRNA-degrading endonuclease RelE of RelBE toxin-antitoxin system